MKPLRIPCWLGRHDWRFTLNFVQEGHHDYPGDYGSNHYSGECRRCGKRDLFRGPYRPEEATAETMRI
jgi:hypothetical protein